MSMEEIIEKKMEEVTQGTEPAEEQEETGSTFVKWII